MKILTGMLSATLAASALLGASILANDRWLWEAAPSHAYGLMVFVVIDIVLAFAVLMGIHFSSTAAALIATVQFGAMLADFVVGGPMSVSSTAFMRYLLGDTSYVGLLIIQLSILMAALASMATPLLSRYRHWIALRPRKH